MRCQRPLTSFHTQSTHTQWGGDAVLFDYFDDPAIPRQGRMDMLKLKVRDVHGHLALRRCSMHRSEGRHSAVEYCRVLTPFKISY